MAVNVASEVPEGWAPRSTEWVANDRLRVQGTRALLAAMATQRVERIVQASVHLVYGAERGDKLLREEADLRPSEALESAVSAERMLLDHGRQGAREATVLRIGWLHDPASWHTQQLLRDLREGRLNLPRQGRYWWSVASASMVGEVVRSMVTIPRPPKILNVADGAALPVGRLLNGVAASMGWPQPPIVDDEIADKRLLRSARMDVTRLADRVRLRDPIHQFTTTAKALG